MITCPSRSTSPCSSPGSARCSAVPSLILPVLRCAGLVVDTAQRSAWRAGRQLDLAPKEFGVLELLLSARGRAVRPKSCSSGRGTEPVQAWLPGDPRSATAPAGHANSRT
jgi:hypothetical protein